MIEWLGRLAHLIDVELGTATALRAIAIALVISWCWTQATKGLPVWWTLTDAQHRWATRWGAFLSGFAPAWLLWPVHDVSAAVMATAVGLASPAAYTLVIRIADHYWPWLDGYVSARPEPPTLRQGNRSDGGS